MRFKLNQINRRNVVSLVLALLLLTTAATPALAWFDEGDGAGQASLPCRVIEDGAGGHTVYCAQANRHHPTVVVEAEYQLRPSIAKAELMAIPAPDIASVEQ